MYVYNNNTYTSRIYIYICHILVVYKFCRHSTGQSRMLDILPKRLVGWSTYIFIISNGTNPNNVLFWGLIGPSIEEDIP